MQQKPFKIKQDDRSPSLVLRLANTSLDVSLMNPRLRMRNTETGAVKIASGALTIVQPTSPPEVAYLWQAGDTDTPGLYEVEVVVTHPGGLPETFPGYDGDNPSVLISPKIG